MAEWKRNARLLRASSFGAAAVAYAEHRPDYAPAAVRWAVEPDLTNQSVDPLAV